MDKLRVAILYGGKSGEHGISLLSASSIMNALNPKKYQLIPIGISKEGEWLLGERALFMLSSILDRDSLDTIRFQLPPYYFQDIHVASILTRHKLDVVFPVLHGTYGEDGTVQGLLELFDLPYVGAGVLSSSVGMDKVMMKKVLGSHDIAQGKYTCILKKQFEKDVDSVVRQVEGMFPYPCFVKPANLGSSVGISKVSSKEELVAALALAGKYDRKIIVEEFVDGREMEISVLGNEDPIVSIPGEIIPKNDFYDFDAKYTRGKISTKIPADLPEDKCDVLSSLAIRAFKAIDASGLARVDFFVKNTGEIFVNEINTMPGFTPLSMYPKLWEYSGISYAELIDRLIALARERYDDKKKLTTTYEVSS